MSQSDGDGEVVVCTLAEVPDVVARLWPDEGASGVVTVPVEAVDHLPTFGYIADGDDDGRGYA